MQTRWGNNDFVLLKEKALYWPEQRTVFISDLHLGKSDFYRRHGIAIPSQKISINISRLEMLLTTLDVSTIVFTGDMIHEELSSETQSFIQWRRTHSLLKLINVLGNHDTRQTGFYNAATINVYESTLDYGSFVVSHEPLPGNIKPNLFGHIHPVFRINDSVHGSIRLPCFVIERSKLILPAFGHFTGGFEIELNQDASIFVVTPQKVIDVSLFLKLNKLS